MEKFLIQSFADIHGKILKILKVFLEILLGEFLNNFQKESLEGLLEGIF